MIRRIKNWYQQRRRRKMLKSIRETMAMFGYDTSHVSDDDLEAEWPKFLGHVAEAIRQIGVSVEQAGVSFSRLGAAVAAFDAALIAAVADS